MEVLVVCKLITAERDDYYVALSTRYNVGDSF